MVGALIVTRYFRKKGWFQDKRLVFVGNNQIIFVYLLLSIVGLVYAFELVRNYRLEILMALISVLLSIYTTILRKLIWTAGFFATGLVSIWLSGYKMDYIPSIILLVISMYLFFFWVSILWDNSELNKPWLEVEQTLRRLGSSQAEIEKFQIYWQSNQKTS